MPDRHHLPAGLQTFSGRLIEIVKATVDKVALADQLIEKRLGKNASQDAWYDAPEYIALLHEVEQFLGAHTMFSVGKKIPEIAYWPAHINTVQAALASIDIAYHMNHRISGRLMFDATTSTMSEGIGHYAFRLDGKRRGIMCCDNPYPSNFDRGIITGTARRIRPNAEVCQDDSQPSRLHGGQACTFIITW